MGAGEKDELLTLLRFTSTRSEGKPVSLADYVGRMAEGQEEIYYLLGSDPAVRRGQPPPGPVQGARPGGAAARRPVRRVHDAERARVPGEEAAQRGRPGADAAGRGAPAQAEESEPVADADWAAGGRALQDGAGRPGDRGARVTAADRQPGPPGLDQHGLRARDAARAPADRGRLHRRRPRSSS